MLGSPERALLERLEDESLLARVFRARTRTTAPAAPALPPRAAGLLAVLRAVPAGHEAIMRAHDGDLVPLLALLDTPADAPRSPRLLHHLALFHGQVADALHAARDARLQGTAPASGVAPRSPAAARSQNTDIDERAAASERMAIEAWALLLSEGRYLLDLADKVAGGALSPAELHTCVEDAALERLQRAGSRLEAEVTSRSESARAALRLLRDIATHRFPASVSPDVVARVRSEAERLRRRALDTELASLSDRFLQAEASPEGAPAECAVLSEAARFYAFSEGDWDVAVFALTRATPTAWSLYKAKRWEPLAQLCQVLRQVVDESAQRVESDPGALPYAATVAQLLVFRAEMGKTLATRILDAERALRLCDSHRNARVILADLLAERAADTLDGTGLIGRDAAIEAALVDLARADTLWTGLPRVASLRKRIDRLSGVTR